VWLIDEGIRGIAMNRDQMRINNQKRLQLFSKALVKMKEQAYLRNTRAIHEALEQIYLQRLSVCATLQVEVETILADDWIALDWNRKRRSAEQESRRSMCNCSRYR
jgi:hypothetical protein